MAKLITTVITPHIVAVVRYEYDPPIFCIQFFKDGVYQPAADYVSDAETKTVQIAEYVCYHPLINTNCKSFCTTVTNIWRYHYVYPKCETK
jgi:hypothetical protein